VYLEPLSDQQIQTYLQQIEQPQLWEQIHSSNLRELLPDWSLCSNDEELPGLRSPLLLNMLLVAYKGRPICSQSELFAAYIEECFRQYQIEYDKLPYTEPQTRRYLTWLAKRLKENKITEFEIENLQPNWIGDSKKILFYHLIVSLILGLPVGFVKSLSAGLIVGLSMGLWDFIFGLNSIRISTIESFNLSIAGVVKGIKFALVGGLFGGVFLMLINVLLLGWIINDFLVGWITKGFLIGCIGAFILGLEIKSIRSMKEPNQGIWDSAKNAVFLGVIFCPVGVLMLAGHNLAAGRSVEWGQWLLMALLGGVLFSMLAWFPVLQHCILRLFLWADKVAPRNYAAFLDYANKLRLIQKIGGRYRFMHDLLRDHISEETS
jgi:hypothetical protein